MEQYKFVISVLKDRVFRLSLDHLYNLYFIIFMYFFL